MIRQPMNNVYFLLFVCCYVLVFYYHGGDRNRYQGLRERSKTLVVLVSTLGLVSKETVNTLRHGYTGKGAGSVLFERQVTEFASN